ncbi:MAG: MauE/DoxX family redox-associated membrane protein [Ktedonobacteraceae bacterium]
MDYAITTVYFPVFLRFFLGIILFSSALKKFAHIAHFRQGILDYHILPHAVEKRFALSALFAFLFPLLELEGGLCLISGIYLKLSLIITIVLLCLFSTALITNLLRGRRDLPCHCGGVTGDHTISWWLVGRNSLYIAGLLLLSFFPAQGITLEAFWQHPANLPSLFVNVVLPITGLVGVLLLSILLLNSARLWWRL